MREMILKAIRGNEGTWETQTESGESHSIREVKMMAAVCPPSSVLFFFLHPFHVIYGYFVLMFTGWRGRGLR